MKIAVPAIRSTEVGRIIRLTGPTRIYNDPDRPNVYGPVSDQPIIEYGLTSVTVFDRDLRVAGRATAIGRLALLTGFYAVAFPLAFVFDVGEQVGKAIESSIGLLGRGLQRVGVEPSGSIRRQYANLAREVVR